MTEMRVDRWRVIATLDDPDASWPAHCGRRIAARNELAVVFDPANHAVVTVLWHTQEEWSRESADSSLASTHRAVA